MLLLPHITRVGKGYTVEAASVKMPEVQELQGDDVATAPKATGIYAWYYRPRVFYGIGKEGVAAAIGQFVNTRTRLESEVKVRYGLRFRGEANLEALYGSDRVSAAEMISESVESSGDFIKAFIQGLMTPHFTKPLYIGIAKVLFNRVYRDHYLDLCSLWESTSTVSRYLSSHQDASIHDTVRDLSLTHSFAIEARVRNLAPRDLVVYVCPTRDLLKLDDVPDLESNEDSPLLRSLEQVLQLLADPICGRR